MKWSSDHLQRADARAHVAADAELGGGRGEQALVASDLARVVAEEEPSPAVVHDAGHLDLVHREDHRGGGAVVAERLAKPRDLRDVEAHAAVLGRHVAGQQALGLHRLEGFLREARVAIDFRARGGDHLAAERVDSLRAAPRNRSFLATAAGADTSGDAHAARPARAGSSNCPTASPSARIDPKVLRPSMLSRNSMSKCSSIASMSSPW
jgi:hypothetical protein